MAALRPGGVWLLPQPAGLCVLRPQWGCGCSCSQQAWPRRAWGVRGGGERGWRPGGAPGRRRSPAAGPGSGRRLPGDHIPPRRQPREQAAVHHAFHGRAHVFVHLDQSLHRFRG